MKFKYYLRGLGVGILVTTIILSLAHLGDKTELTDEEIRIRAEALGMVMHEDKLFSNANKNENTESTEGAGDKADTGLNTETERTESTEHTEEKEEETQEEVVDEREKYLMNILSGMIPSQICSELQEQEVIEDAASLHQYITEMGYATSIIAGEYLIPYGASNEEIYQILKKGPIQ